MKFTSPSRARVAVRPAKHRSRQTAAPSAHTLTFERQADDAAARAMRPSERTAAKALTRAPAARAPTKNSRGAQLPRATRALLEERFGADLEAVRVHTDAPAAEAAAAEGAVAFAAGRDVYFAPGAFSPDMPSGVTLIAHEVAHVLQQTGRMDSRGVVHATEHEGEGALQFVIGSRFPASATRIALDDRYGDNVHLNVLIDQFEKQFKGNAGLTLAIDWVVEQINTLDSGVYERTSAIPSLDELVKQIKAGVDGGQGPGRSFVIEVLALTDGGPGEEYWKAAANVLWRDEEHDLVSRFATVTEPFRAWLRKNRNDDFFARSLTHPRIHPWLDDLFRAYVELIADPRVKSGRDLRGVDGSTGAELTLVDQVKALNAEMDVQPNLSVRDAVAMDLLLQMDGDRIAAITDWGKRIKTETDKRKIANKLVTGFDIRLIAAGLVKEHFDPSKWASRAKVWQDFAEKLSKLATNVEDALKRGLALYEKQRATVEKSVNELTVSNAATKFAGGVVRTSELDKLEALLDKHATKLFDKPSEAGPPPVDYNAATFVFKTDVDKLLGDLELVLVEKLVANPSESISTTNIFVLILLDELSHFLEKSPYKLISDLTDKSVIETSPGVFGGVGQAEDLRRAHRLLTAGYLLRVGLFAGLGSVTKKSSDMVIGDSRSRLIILEDWKESDEPVGKLLTDFPGGRLPLDWTSASEEAAAAAEVPPRPPKSVRVPFTIPTLVNFYSLVYLQTINDEVEKLLQASYASKLDKNSTYSLTAVKTAAKSLKRPKRWAPGKHVIYINPKDPLRYTTSDLISLSGKSKYQVKRDPLGAFRPPYGNAISASPVFMWVIPDLTPMVTFLRTNVPLLDKLITERTGNPPPAKVDDWLYELGTLTDADRLDQVAVHEAIKAALRNDKVGLGFEQRKLLRKSRDLSALRRQIIKLKAADLLIQWKNRPRGGMAGKIAFYKEEALQMVRDYRGEVEPWTDSETQSAALWLDLGPTLDDAFQDGEEIPPDILPRILLAIEASKLQKSGRPTVKNPLDAPVMLEDVIGRGGESVASLTAGEAALESVQRKLIKYLESMQEKTGFYVEDNKFKTWRYGTTFGIKGEFSWDNRNYRIKAIHRKFAYHPPIGGAPSKLKESDEKGAKDIPRDAAVPLFTIDIDDENAPLGQATPRTWALAGPSAEGIPEDRAKRRTLAKPTGKETSDELEERSLLAEKYKEEEQAEKETGRYVVTSADDKLLHVIGFAVELSAMNEDLQLTGELIGGFMDVVVTALEIFLPGGQVIALAEMLAGAVQTVTDPAMIELIENVRQDPALIIEMLWDHIKKFVSFEGLWSILFDDGMDGLAAFSPFATIFEQVRGKRKTMGKLPASTTTSRAKPRGRLGRVVAYIVGLGKRFLRALRVLKLKFKGPLNRIRSTIITRPRLAWILVRAVSFVKAAGDLVDQGFDWFKDVAGDAKEHFTDFAKFFNEMTLPGELVPLDQLYGWVLSFILGKIPKVKLIKPLLDAAGWTDKIAAKLVDWIGIKDSWADPNHWWKVMLLPKLEPHFTEIKREFVHSMIGLVNDFGEMLPTPFKIELPGDDEIGKGGPTLVSDEELQELSSGDPPLAASVSLPQDSGHTLDSSTRGAAESHFGQDFGHVRVHDDASTSVFTTALGAEAATSGSHVYLGPNATSPSSSAILHHELGHVVQQTGSRPLGGAYSDVPVRGASGRGINYDAGKEAAADHMASAGGGGASGGSGDASLGIQPKFSDGLLKKVVDSITRFAPGGAQFKTFAAADTPGVDRAKQIWKDLVTMLPTKKATFEGFISDPKVVKPAVTDRITTPIANKDVASVAAMAQKKVPGQNTPSGDPVTTLNPSFFITLLEGFIFARTGVAMQIDAEHEKSATKLKKLKVYYVHLPLIPYSTDAGKALWDRVMKTPGLVNSKTDGKDGVTKIRHLLNGQLSAKVRPEPFIWDLGDPKFQLSALYVKQFRALLDASRGRDRPTTLEPAKAYAETELSTNKAQSGLRVATHGELTASGHPERSDRDSHHVPQFLLVEFFRNRNASEKAWPSPAIGSAADTAYGKKLHLVKSSKLGLVDSVSPDGHTFRLKDPLDKNESERGVGLPAVLLAVETHQKGSLHLDDKPDEQGDSLSQSQKIKKRWLKELPPELRVDDATVWDKNIAKPGVAGQVANAMKQTYRWLYKEVMMPGLKDALRDIEKPYYEGLASELGHVDGKDNLLAAYELKTSMINNVVKKVEDKNTSIMTDW